MSILRIRNKETGEWEEIPALVGPQGERGETGPAGPKPERGVDYWTPEDKQEVVEAVLTALPVYNGEVEDV